MNSCHTCQVETSERADLTIDELAALAGTTTRRIRSFQTLDLLHHPELRGRTGVYGPDHLTRLSAILRLQDLGFSLESLGVLFRALRSGETLAAVLGLPEPAAEDGDPGAEAGADTAELYGFAELQPAPASARRGRARPLLSVVPTTVWDESEAS
jgi:DNA-binding transcriptional MerR regulator